ncbi:hypothetical protein CC1G_07324 [Coprinopsis cinerea okayama7|uniref:F-box domain-containing protein n=1 Tax=Coprinopsis cinerea (strain Okayama-7 / 130 / ATCC MYA-4618 / FGSC 9003) TaxID=240176 RepID=A8NNR5_COPC7|nr:hypothetical protein CC1G_07324 [Coprinopsis cinerea okayama7\|eukprot:XP_001835182.2 hypothetical protein CC1G_07324 [Coprinopsis cinerea okayama7\
MARVRKPVAPKGDVQAEETCHQKVPDLPVELWLQIAEFLKPEDKVRLLGVNRLFFELAMDQLYRNLSLVSSDIGVFIEAMNTLKNPTVARRVRTVTIWPNSMLAAINSDKNQFERLHRRAAQVAQRVESEGFLSRMKRKVIKNDVQPPVSTSNTFLPRLERKKLFIEGMARLSNVEEVAVYLGKYAGIPTLIDTNFLSECMQALWASVRQTARCVSFDIPTSAFDSIAQATMDNLPSQLFRLELLLRCPTKRLPPVAELANLASPVATFVKTAFDTVDTLKSLKLFADIPGLYEALPVIPQMRCLALEDSVLLRRAGENGSKLHEFLVKNTQLEDLTLIISYWPCPPISPTEERVLPNLKKLAIALPDRLFKCSRSAAFLSSISQNVTELTLKSLSYYSDLKVLFDILSRADRETGTRTTQLRKLEVTLSELSPASISLIAKWCPHLADLKLTITLLVEQDQTEQFEPSSLIYRRVVQSARDQRHSGAFRSWALNDLTIKQWVYGQGQTHNWEAMSAIASVTPSITSFVNRGHMRKAGLSDFDTKLRVIDIGKRSEVWT